MDSHLVPIDDSDDAMDNNPAVHTDEGDVNALEEDHDDADHLVDGM